MRKSPFSTPRGHGGGNRPGFGWKSNERRNNRGYDNQRQTPHDFYSNNSNTTSQEVAGGDFIPFNSSPNNYDRNKERNFYGRGRNRSYGGANHYEGNSPRGHFNNFSPYNARGRRGRNKNFHSGSHRDMPISQFLDILSILEDPWKELIENMNKSTIKEDRKEPETVAIDTNQLNDSQVDEVIRKQDSSDEKSIDSHD